LKIALLLIFYNNKKELERLVNSIPNNAIDMIIAIDGIFKYTAEQNPNLSLLSNDGSREFLLNQQSKYHICLFDMPNVIEVDKRNKYLELAEKYNITVGIVCDSDEYFYYYDKDPLTQWNKFRAEMEHFAKLNKNHNIYSIKTILADDYALMEYPRVWYKPGDMRYFRNSHYHYLNIKNGEYELHKDLKIMHTQQSMGTVQSLFLRHNHALRTEEQLKYRKDYQMYLINFEMLVQKNTPIETADLIAKKYPYPTNRDYDPVGSCACDHCTPPPQKPNFDSNKIIKRKF
jgi:hypothetical protein